MENLIVKYQEFGIEKKQAISVDLAFSEKVEERKAITEMYTQIIKKEINAETANEARQLRLVAVKLKTAIAKIHKTQKEFALAFGKYCDAWKRKETEPTQQIIDKMLEIEKFEERMEAKRLEELQAKRILAIEKYLIDANERDLSSMEVDVWDSFLQSKKTSWEHEQQLIANAEAEAKEKEIEEAKEKERIKKENEKLKAEAEKAAKLEAERAEKAAEDKAIYEAKLKAEAEKAAKLEAERAEKAAEEKAIYEAKLKAEAEKAAKLEAEIKAKKDAEEKAIAEIEAIEKAKLLAPDKEKLEQLAQTIINIDMPVLQSEEAKKIIENIKILLSKTEKYIISESLKL